jgi:hypothetical protein
VGDGGEPLSLQTGPHTEPRDVVIPGLLAPTIEIIDPELGEVRELLAWKRVRPTSAGLYALLQDSGILALSRKRVLNAVAAFRNKKQLWPIADEVQAWLVAAKLIPADGNPNHVRPRLTELSSGWHEVRGPICTASKRNGQPCTVIASTNGLCANHGGDTPIEPTFVACDVLVAAPVKRPNGRGRNVTAWAVRECGR